MSQVNEHVFTTQTEMSAHERSVDTAEAARDFAAAPKTGPAPVDVNNERKVFPVGPRQEGVIGAGKFHPSPSLDPRLIELLDGYEEFGGDLGAVRSCFASAYSGLNAINAAVVQLRSDPTVTPDAAVVKVVAQAERKSAHMFEVFGKTAERIQNTINTLERSLIRPVEERAGLGTINDSIRAHAKGLDTSKRSAFIEDAFKAEDETTLTAICGAPHYLSGVTKEAHALYLRRLHEMRDPGATRRLATLRAASALIERAFPIAMDSVEKALGSSFKRAKELKAGAAASEAALKAIMTPSAE